MSVTVFQRYPEDADDQLKEPAVDQEWMATGSDVPATIYAAGRLAVPSTYRGLYLQSVKYSHKGGGVWDLKAHYGRTPPISESNFGFSADSTGKTVRVEVSKLTTVYTEDGSPAPSFNGLIDVDPRRGEVKGVELPTPSFTFQVVKKYKVSDLDPNYLNRIVEATGKVNQDAFTITWKNQYLPFQEGEVLYHGPIIGDGGKDEDGNDLLDVTHKFEWSANASNFWVGPEGAGGIKVLEKGGWEALWVLSQDSEDASSLVKQPLAVYVETVADTFGIAELQL